MNSAFFFDQMFASLLRKVRYWLLVKLENHYMISAQVERRKHDADPAVIAQYDRKAMRVRLARCT